jgi:uncharacterized damage-inducible protein DinB
MTKAQYLSWFDEVVGPTESIFHLVPEDKLQWRLVESSFNVGQILKHIPLSLEFFAKVINNEPLPVRTMREIMIANRHQKSATVEEAVADMRRATARFKEAVNALQENQFQHDELDTPQKGRVPYWRYCTFALEHHIHHLMELHLNLKVLGIAVNTKTLYAG